MRSIAITTFSLFISTSLMAQSFTSPESVEYDAANDRYLVSNSGDGNIVALDQLGTITSFATGIPSGPFGLEILGNVVYACAGGRVRGYDLSSGAEVFNVNVNGSFLNGITTDGTDLYVTDFGDDKVLKVDVAGQSYTTLVANTQGTPNGIHYDPNFGLGMLFVAFWGNNAPVKAYDPNTGAAGPVINTSLTDIDGITQDCLGNLYLASWSPDAITKVDASSGVQTNTGWVVNNPADIDFDMVNAVMCIPNTNGNTVSLETVNNCVTGVLDQQMLPRVSIAPNPCNGGIRVMNASLNSTYRIYDAAMRQVMAGMVPSDGNVNVTSLDAGAYFLELNGEGQLTRFVRADR